jgi:hypothetical protein
MASRVASTWARVTSSIAVELPGAAALGGAFCCARASRVAIGDSATISKSMPMRFIGTSSAIHVGHCAEKSESSAQCRGREDMVQR